MTLARGLKLSLAAAALVFCQLFGGPAFAAPHIEVVGGSASEADVAADETVTHRASGFVYPKQIGDMPLRKIIVYGPGDVSADYTNRGGGNGDAWTTFYVYPAEIGLDDELANIEGAIGERLTGAEVKAPASPPATMRGGRSKWYKGKYGGLDVTTGYAIVQRGDWFLKARFTIPDQAGQEGIDRTVAAVAALPWEWSPSASQARDQKVAAR